jgi:PAS domain S-box-containing protein
MRCVAEVELDFETRKTKLERSSASDDLQSEAARTQTEGRSGVLRFTQNYETRGVCGLVCKRSAIKIRLMGNIFRSRKVWLRSVVIVALGVWPGGGGSLTAAETPVERVVLQLKWTHQFQFAGYYAAVQQGYYREAGLEVALVEAQPGRDPVNEVIEGRADFGVGTSELVVLRAQGKPVVVLAAVFQHSPLVLLATGRAAEQDLQALHDKPLMIEPQSAELFAYFRNEGVDTKKLRIEHHTFSVDDLVSGRVAAMSAYSTDEPFLLQRAKLSYTLFSPRAGGIDFYGDNLFTTEAQARDHPKRVRAFRAASLKGWDYALAHPGEIIDLIRREHPDRKSREHLEFEAERTIQLMHPGLIEVGHMNPGRWRHIADTYAEFGMVPQGFPLDGLLYEADPRPNLGWVYWTLGGAGLITLALAGWLAPLLYYNRRLTRSEKQYRELADRAPFPVTISDVETGRFLFANRLAGLMLKAGPEELTRREAVEFYADGELRTSLLERLEREGGVSDEELCLKDSEGRLIWALLSASLIEFGGRRGLVAAFQEITRRREMEGELRRAKEEAEQANAARNRYLALLSHDIRTPMNGIIGMTDLVLSDTSAPLSGEQSESLGMVKVAAESLLHLVNELLDWSQLEAGAMQVEETPVHLGEFLVPLAGLFRPGAEAKGVELQLRLEPDVPVLVWTDPLRLRQILSNLLSNAVKFTAKGRIEVLVSCADSDRTGSEPTLLRLRLAVKDTGVGIPAAVQTKLFFPYRQADASVARRYGGSGLGLSISRELARLLGGDITLESRDGEGSTFTVEVRVRKESMDGAVV